eukprot:TRINITY_DN58831_c0_g1_i1.p1 TRINITY_DN58831_c0_g1~~TRINITY_DN58831_c0_g1_i1.p1  ORF type:complete len:151 (-),score=32.52 TRINITY_DN58831_c0_g1_i1:39-491(-)
MLFPGSDAIHDCAPPKASGHSTPMNDTPSNDLGTWCSLEQEQHGDVKFPSQIRKSQRDSDDFATPNTGQAVADLKQYGGVKFPSQESQTSELNQVVRTAQGQIEREDSNVSEVSVAWTRTFNDSASLEDFAWFRSSHTQSDSEEFVVVTV